MQSNTASGWVKAMLNAMSPKTYPLSVAKGEGAKLDGTGKVGLLVDPAVSKPSTTAASTAATPSMVGSSTSSKADVDAATAAVGESPLAKEEAKIASALNRYQYSTSTVTVPVGPVLVVRNR